MFEKNEFNLMEYLLVNIDYETEFEIISNPKTSYSNLLLTGEFNFDGNLLFNAKFFAKRTNVRIATVVLQIIDSEKESESFPKTAVEIKKLKVVGDGEIKFKVGTLCNFWKIKIIKIILLFTIDILKKSVIIKIEREVCESNYFKLGGLLRWKKD